MRFKIGSLVEVLTKKKVPLSAWRCAEIVADNGDSYTVRFYRGRGVPKEGVDKVKAEDVRPTAPMMIGCVTWSVGDVVEVLDDGYWKVSMIEEVLGEYCYQIRVIGSIDEFRVKKSSIRARQEWKDNKWIPIGEISGNCDDPISRMRKKARIQQQQCRHSLQLIPDSAERTKMSKRSCPDSLSNSEAKLETVEKRRVVNEKVNLDVLPDDCYSFIGKVDVPTHYLENNGKKQLQLLTDINSIERGTKLADTTTNLSSAASCSVVDAISDRGLSHYLAGCSQDDDSLCSDAESSKTVGHDKGVSLSNVKWEDTLRSRDLDLSSYRYILETLYASGPLTWDQEVLLTDTRMKFDVSNDEHLAELRRLKCVGNLGLRCH